MIAKNKKIFFSIDDGHPDDLFIAEWLLKNNFPAIFYIPINNCEGRKVMSKKEIKMLSKNFEIGAHTLTHPDLLNISLKQAKKELVESKKILEDILGKEVLSFAPPKGHYNKEIVDLAYSLGFTSFRSARLLNYHFSDKTDRIWHPNLHIYPHRLIVDLLHCRGKNDYSSLIKRLLYFNKSHLEQLPILLKKHRSIHLWGHGWEIKEQGINLQKLIFNINNLNP